MEIFEPFMLNGFVSLSGDNCPPTPIKILRDTGASQSLILADILPFSEKTSSGTSVLIQGVECGTANIPLHHVNLSSDLVTGLVVIGITPSLPFKGVHLLLGNDLAGDQVVVNPLVTDTPNIGQTDDPIEQEIPDLYPSCAVTRAMAKRAILKNSNSDIDLTDTFICQYSRTSIARTSLSRTYPYVEVFSRSRSHCSLFQYNSTSIHRIYISKFIHTSNEFRSPITIVRTYSHIFTPKLICKR